LKGLENWRGLHPHLLQNSEQLEMFPRVSISTNPSSAVIYTDVSNIVLRITCKEDLIFELINESTVICNGLFDCENIKILIKWLYKQKKSSKTKKVKTLYEQFKSTIPTR
jgi:hypothetical protein